MIEEPGIVDRFIAVNTAWSQIVTFMIEERQELYDNSIAVKISLRQNVCNLNN